MRQPGKTITRQQWFRLHSFAGASFALLLFFVSLTGTLAVFAYEIDWLITPELRVSAEGRAPLPAGTLLAAAHSAAKDGQVSSLRLLPPFMASEAILRTASGELNRIYIDPYTAKVIAIQPWFNAHRFLRQTHRHLMLPLKWGLTIVCLLSLPLLLSLASAFPIYKKWWQGFAKRPKPNTPPRRWWGDLHRLIGLWCVPFIALIAITGLWYLIERWGGAAPSATKPLADLATLNQPHNAVKLNAAIDQALNNWPDFVLKGIIVQPNKPLLLQGQASAWLVRDRANTLAVDANTATTLTKRQGESLTVHQRIAEMADPLHFGTFAGYLTKFIWFLFGAMMTALCASGFWLCALRLGTRRSGPKLGKAWQHMGWSRWPQMGLVAASLALALMAIF
ncbi:PepSY-associated TM helix domain-containing protein [Gilvimarinus sp. SDUM040013]|uniref:PepSY-associated TM helix domain-containing protein n=1 Tax=Gilvimarinus gilvus TaxID=3058038 RepID=A0ABU4S2I5_9GAMM|nr:PepSY-associated TM helix domain-containing protein [Gilvimarinus sp. SDUM040013]MDO3384893.1 PepSY-associated TM helix domain-containing protein [Gilvimarinus sp. SDUM040013]MDX6850682.1 PepSY-associated TM helix domain-containing protein [Gilvimarinus sp. SDUM040013]